MQPGAVAAPGNITVRPDGVLIGKIPEIGRKMLRFPGASALRAHVSRRRGARLCRPVALMAALTQGRSFLLRAVSTSESRRRARKRLGRGTRKRFLPADAARGVTPKVRTTRSMRAVGSAFTRKARGRWGRCSSSFSRSRRRRASIFPSSAWTAPRCASACSRGFSDQLAKRLDAGTLRCELVHKRRGVLARESAIQKAPLLVAAEISEIGGRGGEVNVLAVARDRHRGGLAEGNFSRTTTSETRRWSTTTASA